MTTDFRALCAELVESFIDENTYTQRVEILDRACGALATPPPEPPTDQELVAFLYLIDPEDELSPLAMVRAALERWGN